MFGAMTTSSFLDSQASSSPTEATAVDLRSSDDEVIVRPEVDYNGPPARSEKFWFADGTVVIKVQNTLYKIYKGILTRHSRYFLEKIRANFEIAPKKKGSKLQIIKLVGAGSEDKPLVLSVKKNDFELLLSYMFPGDYTSQDSFTMAEWAAIAQVSEKLQIHSVRNAAVSKILKSASSCELIVLGRRHGIPACYVEGIRQMCVRESSMTLEEGEGIGLATVIEIAHARDLLAKGSKWSEIVLSAKLETVA